MSNYHGIPNYGGAFNYNGHFPPSIPPLQQAGLYGMMPQASFPPPRGPPSIPPPPPPPQTYQPPHFSHPYNYSANSAFPHTIVPGSGPPPITPYPYYANYVSHAANGIPPPPFPPIPIPNHNFAPQRSATSIPLPASPGTLSSLAGLPPKPPSPIRPSNGVFEIGVGPVAPGNDREDGELSDAEKRKTSSEAGSAKSGVQQEGTSASHGGITTPTATQLQPLSTATVELPKDRNQHTNQSIVLPTALTHVAGPQSPQGFSQIIHTANTTSTFPSQSVNNANSVATANQKPSEQLNDSPLVLSGNSSPSQYQRADPSTDLRNVNRPNSPAEVVKQGTGGKYQSLRGQVKSALLDLHQGQIRFESLVAEGVDASILRGLYNDIGLQVGDDHMISNRRSPIRRSSLQSTSFQNILPSDVNGPPETSLSSLASSESLIVSIGQHKSPGPISSALVSKLTESPGNRESLTATVPASSEALENPQNNSQLVLPASQLAKLAGVSLIKSPASGSSGDRTLERKDYIAKMLAAKVGKVAALKIPKPVEPVNLLKDPPNQDLATPNIVVAAPSSAPSSSFAVALLPTTQNGLDAKKKASTDLARRKMEALKTRSTEAGVETAGSAEVFQIEETLPQITTPVSREKVVLPAGQSPTQPQTQVVEQSITVSNSSSQQYTPATPFFAPLERKPTTGLPGLSMLYSSASSPTSLPIDTVYPVVQSSISDQDSSTKPVSLPEPEAPVSQPSIDSVSTVDDLMTGVIATSRVENVAPIIPRKRATAADFIDGPADNMKRRAGSNGHVEVVIEVSDDEGVVEEDDDDNDMDIDVVVQESSTEALNPARSSDSRPKAIRDLPPLTNFLPRSIAANATHTSSPTPGQIPAKNGEPRELTETEEKIRLLKQMIAEKEERQRAKLTSSGAQSPAPTTHNALPNVPSIRDPSPARSSSGSLILEKKKQALDVVEQELEDQKVILVAVETAVQGRLEAEEHAHASVSARAEEERAEAARATTTVERQYREERRLALEAALPELDAQIQVARGKLDDISRQRVELEAELQRGSEGRKRILEELDMLLAALEADKNIDDALSDEAHIRGSSDGLMQAQDGRSNFRDSPATSKREPTTPSTITSTISRVLENDNTQEIVHINGFSSRQPSAEEVMDISSVSNDDAHLNKISPSNSPQRLDRTESDLGYDEYEPRLENDLLSQPSAERDRSIHSVPDEVLDHFPPTQVHAKSVNQDTVGQKQGPLDSKSSSLEDGEVSHNMSSGGADDSDDYEPPEPQSLVDNRTSQETEIFSPISPPPQLTKYSKEEIVPELLTPMLESPIIVDLTTEGDTSHDVSTVRNVSHTPLSLKLGHFTPYQSPLNIFTSYRYHPKYVSEVAGGFRSLTYSHKIDPKEPLCRWELAGGTCNDDSCKYQHFRSMGLTDDMILVQLGSIHEGSSLEEKNAYVSGLKQIIHEMRSRRVTDFNIVAQEITAYRASFLKDSSRILTL